MEVATTKNNNRGGGETTSSSARPQKAKGLLEGSSVIQGNLPAKGILKRPVIGRGGDYRIVRNFSSIRAQEQSGSDWRTWGRKNCRCGRPGLKIVDNLTFPVSCKRKKSSPYLDASSASFRHRHP